MKSIQIFVAAACTMSLSYYSETRQIPSDANRCVFGFLPSHLVEQFHVTSDKFPNWQGNILVGALAHIHVARVELKDGKYLKEEKLLDRVGRVRAIGQSPDGFIYVATEGPRTAAETIADKLTAIIVHHSMRGKKYNRPAGIRQALSFFRASRNSLYGQFT